MSQKNNFISEDNEQVLLNIVKNTVGESFLYDVDEKINRLLTTVSVSDVLERKCDDAKSIVSFCNVLKSVKLILELLEWSLRKDCSYYSKIGVGEVLQSLRDIFDSKPCGAVTRDAMDLLLAVSKVCALRVEETENIAKFYLYHLHLVQHGSNEEDVRLRLRALCVILATLSRFGNKECVVKFREQVEKQKECVDESRLFSKLILQSHESISVQALLTVLPHFVELFETTAPLLTVWNEALQLGVDDDLKHFSALCHLFDVFAAKTTTEGTDSFTRLLQNEKYWKAVQCGLTHSENVARRQALYLLKRSIQEMFERDLTLVSHELNEISGSHFVEKLDGGLIKLSNGMKNFTICNSKMFLVSSESESVMWWHVTLKEELSNLFNDIFLVLETLEEKQAHIVKPIFQTMIRLLGPTVCPFRNGKCLHISWMLVLFQRILEHDNAAVVRWGILNLMEVDISLYSTPILLKKILHLFVSHINNPSVFATDLETTREELRRYFEAVASAVVAKPFFQVLLEEICSVTWSPEPLFIVLDALQQVQVLSWETEHLLLIKSFVTTSIATQYTFLRAAVQCHLLQTIINLTDVAAISLDTLASVLSAFRGPECLTRGSGMWKALATWIEYCFSKRNAEDFILANVPGEASKVSRMVCLLYDAHLFGIMKCCGEVPSCKVISVLMDFVLSFKGADKRLYAAPAALNANLNMLRGILSENLSGANPERSRLVEIMVPHLGDILAFVVSRSIGLEDYETAQMFVETVELILKAQKMFRVNSELYTNSILMFSLQSLGILGPASAPPLVNYVCMHYLKLIIEYVYQETTVPRLKLLQAFFKKSVNVPLPKPESESELRSMWGRINGEYLEAQWRIIGRLKGENILTVGQKVRVEQFLTSDELCEESLAALTIGGSGVLLAVLTAAEDFLPELQDEAMERLAAACWTTVWDARRSDAFAPAARRFITVLFQPELLQKPSCQRLLIMYASLLLSESVNGLANAFLTHAQSIGIKYAVCPLWEQVLASAVIFGSSGRREDRLTHDVTCLIASLPCPANQLVTNDWNGSSEVRARALHILLTLNPDTHTAFADGIAEALLNKELELTGSKSRSFAGSAIHLVRTRVLQALLVLEPLLSKERCITLYNWLCSLLLRESQQPSVRYMAEWLIVRLLWRNEELQSALWLNFTEALEQRVGSLCSFISVVYHTMSVLPDSALEAWLDRAIVQFLPYCLAQHFSLRLYAQVAIEKMWLLAEGRGFRALLDKYRIIRECQLRSIGNGNALRNAEKLRQDFYWTVFHPLRHYSLLTIFRDLPRLAHLKPYEWITPELLSKVGVPSGVGTIPWSCGDELWLHPVASWTVRNEESSMEVPIDNFQKKLIPVKSLLPNYDEMLSDSSSSFSRKKQNDTDGLVVVASLIDRPANLGGLSRTCEAFGVSELVIDSLQTLEDKQFQSLSVTAEKWVAITEIKVHYLSDYLLRMKSEGYTVVGAEQTSRSQPLHHVQFPRRSLLLLGSEKEGLPPQLLPLLDVCVEVPQLGVVRSLNVHVTGALFVWEYAKQHALAKL